MLTGVSKCGSNCPGLAFARKEARVQSQVSSFLSFVSIKTAKKGQSVSIPELNMSRVLAERLDLIAAWLRVKTEELGSLFVRKPNEIALAELDLDEWLREISESVSNGTYNPSPMVVCDVPKPKSVIRPGAILSVVDRVVYS